MGGLWDGEALSKEKKEMLSNKRNKKKNDHLMEKNRVGFLHRLQSKLKVD